MSDNHTRVTTNLTTYIYKALDSIENFERFDHFLCGTLLSCSECHTGAIICKEHKLLLMHYFYVRLKNVAVSTSCQYCVCTHKAS